MQKLNKENLLKIKEYGKKWSARIMIEDADNLSFENLFSEEDNHNSTMNQEVLHESFC